MLRENLVYYSMQIQSQHSIQHFEEGQVSNRCLNQHRDVFRYLLPLGSKISIAPSPPTEFEKDFNNSLFIKTRGYLRQNGKKECSQRLRKKVEAKINIWGQNKAT